MSEFETRLNSLLVGVFNYILRFEEMSLKMLSNTSVTVAEAHILEVIGRRNNSITVSNVAAAMNISAPTATVAVKKLEGKGFVTKTACAGDGRRFIIGLTRAGEKINRAHGLFHMNMVKEIARGLSDTEKDALMVAVEKLHEFFKEKVEA